MKEQEEKVMAGRKEHDNKQPTTNRSSTHPTGQEEEDVVNHPKHYTFGKFEVLEVIEDWGLGFHRGNAVKYIARAGKKNKSKEVEDLEKARFYIQREIDRLKGGV